jgi:hypothetical protein
MKTCGMQFKNFLLKDKITRFKFSFLILLSFLTDADSYETHQ